MSDGALVGYGVTTLLFIFAFAVIMVVHGIYLVRNRVPYVVLPDGAMDVVANKLKVRSKDLVFDLGCGDGRVLKMLQQREPKARYVGIENDWMVWLRAKLSSRSGIVLVRGEISNTKLGAATRVFAYLGPKMMSELEPRFERELPAGARVVSVQFPLPGRTPDEVVDLPHSKAHAAKLYVYNY